MAGWVTILEQKMGIHCVISAAKGGKGCGVPMI